MNNDPDRMGPPVERWMMLTTEGPEYFETEEEARDAAAEAINDYAEPDGRYNRDVNDVVVACVVAYAHPVNVVERPGFQELDEGGYDAEGNRWTDDDDQLCDYELLDVDVTEDDEL